MSKFKLQSALDHLGPEMLQVCRYTTYIIAVYLWLCAICAPMSEYCYWGPYKWFKLWQKSLFGLFCAFAGYGWFNIGQSLRTTQEKAYQIHAA